MSNFHLPQNGSNIPRKKTMRDPKVYVRKHPDNIIKVTPTAGYRFLKLYAALPSMDT